LLSGNKRRLQDVLIHANYEGRNSTKQEKRHTGHNRQANKDPGKDGPYCQHDQSLYDWDKAFLIAGRTNSWRKRNGKQFLVAGYCFLMAVRTKVQGFRHEGLLLKLTVVYLTQDLTFPEY
jgi:hypothetical protein